jgi:hypothetical protein
MDVYCIIIDGFLSRKVQFDSLNFLQNLQKKQIAANLKIKFLQLAVVDNVFVCDSYAFFFSPALM